MHANKKGDGTMSHRKTNQIIGTLFSDKELDQIIFRVINVVKHPCPVTHDDPKYRYVQFEIAITSSVLQSNVPDSPHDRLEDITRYSFGFVVDINDPDSIQGMLVRIERRIAKNESTYFMLYEAACSLADTPKSVTSV